MKAKPNYDYGYLRVEPKSAGDFGSVKITSIEYEDDEHLTDMETEIKRHVDRVGRVDIFYDYYTCGICNGDYETEEEAEKCCSK